MTDTSGPRFLSPFAFYDPDSRSLRTSQGTFLLDSTPCSVTLPASGSMLSGALYERLMLEPATSASDCSSRLPTPTSRDWKGQNQRGDTSCVPGAIAALLPTPAVNDMGEGKTVEWWDDWTAKMQEAHGNGNGHGRSLAIEERLLPTPTSTTGRNLTAGRSNPDSEHHDGVTLEDWLWLSTGLATDPRSNDTSDSPDGQLPLLATESNCPPDSSSG